MIKELSTVADRKRQETNTTVAQSVYLTRDMTKQTPLLKN